MVSPDPLSHAQRELVEQINENSHTSQSDIGEALGVGRSTVSGHISKIRDKFTDDVIYKDDDGCWRANIPEVDAVDSIDNGGESEEAEIPDTLTDSEETEIPSTDALPDGLIDTLRSEGLTYDQLEQKYGWSSKSSKRLLQQLREAGYVIEFETVNKQGKRIWYIPEEGDKRYNLGIGNGDIKFGLISDTHLGSDSERLADLHRYYDRLVEEGVNIVLHAGDIGDGWEVHRNHINAIKGEAAGWKRLRDYVVENYPQRDGIDTLFIEGNHDHKLYRREGIRFGELVEDEREDLHYLGDSQARVVFHEEADIDIELMHPAGGKPYTLGYRLQTLYRERPLNDRPTLAGVGHLHGMMQASAEGVMGFYTGCWKDLTTYGKRRGHKGEIGGWIVDLEIRDDEIRSMGTRWMTYGSGESEGSYTLSDISSLVDNTPKY